MGRPVTVKTTIMIKNFPEGDIMDCYPYITVRYDDVHGDFWYWSAFDSMDRAQQAAKEIDGFVVVSLGVIE